jgi:hypothetical protein
MFSNHVYKIIILATLVIRIPKLEIFLFCQHNSTGGGNLELRQTIGENSQILTVSNKKKNSSVTLLQRRKKNFLIAILFYC